MIIKWYKIFIFGLFFILRVQTLHSQDSKQSLVVDSLKKVLKTEANDTVKCKALYKLTLIASDEEWPEFNKQLKNFCEIKLKNISGKSKNDMLRNFYLFHLSNAISNEGYLINQKNNFTEALELYKKSLKIRAQLKNKAGIANSLNNIGHIYNSLGDIPLALDYFNRSLKIQEEVKDKKGAAYS